MSRTKKPLRDEPPGLFPGAPEPKGDDRAPEAPKVPAKRGAPVRALAARDEPVDLLKVLAAAAADPKVQPEKMRLLYDMHKEITAERARLAFIAAFGAMQDQLPVIKHNGTLDQGVGRVSGRKGAISTYATFPAINRVLKPILREHNLALWFEPDVGADGKIVVRGHLTHVDGYGVTGSYALPLETSGSKNNVQGIGSSTSYGKRYLAIALCNIQTEAPEDKDDDGKGAGRAVERITPEQAQTLSAAAENAGIGAAKICEVYGIEQVEDLPAEHLAEITKRIGDFVSKKNGAQAHHG
jgi:hypothetical protein